MLTTPSGSSPSSPSSAVRLRRLTTADAPALHAARIAALTDAPYAFSSTLEQEQRHSDQTWHDRLASDRSVYAGVFDGGRLAGMAAGLVPGYFDDPGGTAPVPAEGAWHLVSMWVSPDLRGQGIADALVTDICAAAQARGGTEIELWVTEVNPRALAFYRRAGFAPTGDRQLVRPDEPDHWEIKMSRPLR